MVDQRDPMIARPMVKRRRDEPELVVDFFVYSTAFIDIVDLATATNTINIQADSDFRLEKITAHAMDDTGSTNIATNVIDPRFLIQITDTGAGRNLFDNPIPVAALFGSGKIPFILGTPRIFAARSTITVVISSFNVGTDLQTLRLLFIGTKIFKD